MSRSMRDARPSIAPSVQISASPSDESSGQPNRLRKLVFGHHAIDRGAPKTRETHDDADAEEYRRVVRFARLRRQRGSAVIHRNYCCIESIGRPTLGWSSGLFGDDFGSKSTGRALLRRMSATIFGMAWNELSAPSR
jgi:hypothetical protein